MSHSAWSIPASAHVDGAAAIKAAPVQHRPVVFDVARVFADQVIGQLFNGSGHRMRAALHDGLAPADDAFVRLDFQEAPPGRHDVGGELGDLHAWVSWAE